jgi:hypothetical protein
MVNREQLEPAALARESLLQQDGAARLKMSIIISMRTYESPLK